MGEDKLIKSHIMNYLGRPHNLYDIKVKNVARHTYRVNVEVIEYTNSFINSTRISDSFYVKVNNFQVVHVNPPVIKRY